MGFIGMVLLLVAFAVSGYACTYCVVAPDKRINLDDRKKCGELRC